MVPITILVVFNRQLQGFVDRLEYFADSLAMASRILPATFISTEQQKVMDRTMPSGITPKPTPTKTGNSNEVDLATFTTPAMISAIPAMMLATMIQVPIKIDTLVLALALMLPIDSRNSSGEMIPLS